MTDKKPVSTGKRKRENRSDFEGNFFVRLGRDIKKHKMIYLMALPVIAYYLIFHYGPMYGALIAFQDYNPARGIWGSDWVGFKHFIDFFQSRDFNRVFFNTLWISLNGLVFGFPAPIILALLINEIKRKSFARVTQTITYLPHFISMVVVCGMIKDFTSESGIITQFLGLFGFPQQSMLSNKNLFVPILVLSDIWQGVGWGSIIYLAALQGIDDSLYEAASIDGAGRLRQTWHITLPGILPTVVIMLILKIGGLLSVGSEKILLLYSPLIYDTSDVISTYVYRRGLEDFAWSFSTAVGLFNSVINCILLVGANYLSKKIQGSSLW